MRLKRAKSLAQGHNAQSPWQHPDSSSSLLEVKVQSHSTPSHITIPKSLAIKCQWHFSVLSRGDKMYPQTSSLCPQPDLPTSEMFVLWLNVAGPVFTAQPGRSQNKSGEEAAQSPPSAPTLGGSMAPPSQDEPTTDPT